MAATRPLPQDPIKASQTSVNASSRETFAGTHAGVTHRRELAINGQLLLQLLQQRKRQLAHCLLRICSHAVCSDNSIAHDPTTQRQQYLESSLPAA